MGNFKMPYQQRQNCSGMEKGNDRKMGKGNDRKMAKGEMAGRRPEEGQKNKREGKKPAVAQRKRTEERKAGIGKKNRAAERMPGVGQKSGKPGGISAAGNRNSGERNWKDGERDWKDRERSWKDRERSWKDRERNWKDGERNCKDGERSRFLEKNLEIKKNRRSKAEEKEGVQSRPAEKWEAGIGKGRTLNREGRSRCRAFGECGGCQMLHLPYEEQLIRKEKETAKLLKPYVKLEGIIGMEQPEHYRNKVNAAFTHDRQGKPLSGVYKEGTHYIIPIEECMLENEKADEIIGSIRALLPSFKIKTFDEDTGYGLLRHVMVRVAHSTGQIMVVLVLSSPILPSKNNFVKALLKRHPDITTIVTNINEKKTSMVLGDNGQVIYGKGYIEDVLCGIRFKISPKSFYQINSVQAEKLYNKAIEYAGLTGMETVLDAYCGIGTIGMVASGKAKRVIGVELNGDAARDAMSNARRNKIKNIEFYQMDAGELMVQLEEQGERVDTVFMDPPRTGSDEVFLSSLVKLAPGKVVYISCNPETLARDLEYLVKRGYQAVRGVCVDMFPFCGHIETICCLSRIK